MHLTFKETKEEVYAAQRVSKHVSPHLHNALEIVCVTEGTLEMGVGQELYHMEKGDIGFVFSDIIHHYQVFSEKTSRADYILVPSSFAGVLKDKIQAYVQIVLARCIGKMELVEKSCVGSDDLIYRTVSYISGNFRRQFSLEDMARDLGVSKYVLSRVFSKTFHRNFNQYLNDARLSYACTRLVNTSDTILNICLDSGFDSQRTFNRVFKERYKTAPSEYRKNKRRNG